jgi:hypothetical protein
MGRMLETSQERVKLLKAGISGKTIEKLYLLYNDIKLVNRPVLLEPFEINGSGNQGNFLVHDLDTWIFY